MAPRPTQTELAASPASPTSVPSEEERRRRRWAAGWGAPEQTVWEQQNDAYKAGYGCGENPDREPNWQGGGDEGEPYRRSRSHGQKFTAIHDPERL